MTGIKLLVAAMAPEVVKMCIIAYLPQNKLSAALLVKWDGKSKGVDHPHRYPPTKAFPGRHKISSRRVRRNRLALYRITKRSPNKTRTPQRQDANTLPAFAVGTRRHLVRVAFAER